MVKRSMRVVAMLAVAVSFAALSAPPKSDVQAREMSGNPILPGWYADPEAAVFGDTYWIYPTTSKPYAEQVGFDAFSSPDLVHWTRHPNVLSMASIPWAKQALWAPAVVEKDGRYYFFFSANDIQNDNEVGGIGVAVADRPEGPYRDLLGKPLIGEFHNGAQPIDQFVFKDDDGSWYMIYGGWRHANMVRLKDDFSGIVPMADGSLYKEITPAPEYVEGSLMFKRDGRYYFMWSEGGWGEPEYSVAYAIAESPTGPFKRIGKILQQDPEIATSAGHHSLIHAPGSDNWYIVYHRRPLGETDRNHRVTAIDRMVFDEQGHILPVKMTRDGVPADPMRAAEATRRPASRP
jgi:beta-xylosidase